MAPNIWNHYTTQSGLAMVDHSATASWRMMMTRHDGGTHLTAFPMSTLEWRVAEYGFDPTDIDGLLDIIIHEQFLNYDDPIDADLPSLFKAGSQQEAREAHLERIDRVKKQRTLVQQSAAKGAPHPFDIIRKGHGITQAGVEAKVARFKGTQLVVPPERVKADHKGAAAYALANKNKAAELAPKVELKVIGSQ